MEAAPGRSAEPGGVAEGAGAAAPPRIQGGSLLPLDGRRVSDSRLRAAVQQLAAVQHSARQLVRKAEEERRGREAAAERLAELLAEVDGEAYERVMSAVRAAGKAEMRSARTMAREILALASRRALDTVAGYPGISPAAQARNRALEKHAERLAAALAAKSPEAAAAVRASFQRAADARLESATRHDREVVGAMREVSRNRKREAS